jgi:murein DD-endopeptidase MepM/ murein hydrolase activator NlpD
LLSAETSPAPATSIDSVVLHRLFREFYSSSEHFDGEESALGDALGADCLVQRIVTVPNGKIVRAFQGDGSRNEDWYGWNAEVLAPFDAVIERVHHNGKTNLPGQFGTTPASSIVFLRKDGMRAMFAHVQNIRVGVGDQVRAGQVVALVGNNGFGSCPHIHVGAWKENRPFQIRWDLRSGKTRHP